LGKTLVACFIVYISKNEVAFLEDPFLFSQPKQFKKLSKSSDWLEKSRLLKKPLCFWRCK